MQYLYCLLLLIIFVSCDSQDEGFDLEGVWETARIGDGIWVGGGSYFDGKWKFDREGDMFEASVYQGLRSDERLCRDQFLTIASVEINPDGTYRMTGDFRGNRFRHTLVPNADSFQAESESRQDSVRFLRVTDKSVGDC